MLKNKSSIKKILVKIAIVVVVLFVLIYLWFALFHDHENSHGSGTSAQNLATVKGAQSSDGADEGHQHGAGYADWMAGKKSAQIEQMFTVIAAGEEQDWVRSYRVTIDPVAKEFYPNDFKKVARKRKLRKQKLIDTRVDGQNVKVYSKIDKKNGEVKFVFDALGSAQFVTSYGNLYPGADYTIGIAAADLYYLSVEDGSGQAQYWRVDADGVSDISLLIQEKLANKFADYKQFPSFTLQFAQNTILFDEVRYCCEEFHPTNSKPKSFQIAYDDLSLSLKVQ